MRAKSGRAWTMSVGVQNPCKGLYLFSFFFQKLADIAMTEAADYKAEYRSPIPVKYLTDCVSNYVHVYTLYLALRPFGTTIMIGSYTDIEGPELYCIENSGLYYFVE